MIKPPQGSQRSWMVKITVSDHLIDDEVCVIVATQTRIHTFCKLARLSEYLGHGRNSIGLEQTEFKGDVKNQGILNPSQGRG
mmetsp:Transcript_8678/g.13705  ORF Transcript_8678/g.13705 Transcript_8678/m.13705 type:complete len:82 (-) Transcript_8678:212-457(-)